MEISPGIEFAWLLAGREANIAHMPLVEPEHFLCALLKFSEMDEDDLRALAARPKVVADLTLERDQLRAILKENSLANAHLRHDLRRVMGQGNCKPTGEPLHRSDASRQLFELAVRRMQPSQGFLDAPTLLKTILDYPTPAMRQAWGERAAKKSSRPAIPAPPQQEPYAQAFAQLGQAGKFAVPEACAPQVLVLALVLRSAGPTPGLLICAPSVPVLSILGCASQSAPEPVSLFNIDYTAMLQAAPDLFLDQMDSLLNDAGGAEKRILFFDATGQKMETIQLLLRALKPGLASSDLRLLVALSEDDYVPAIESAPDLEGVFRTIWLHDLSQVKVPDEL